MAASIASRVRRKIQNWFWPLVGEVQSWSYDLSNTVVITGSPRSGTTWLAELFAQIPGGCILWEPLHLARQSDLVKFNFTWRTHIRPDDHRPEAEQLFRDILSGKRLNAHTASLCNFNQIWHRKFWIIKSVRANGLLEWLVQHFSVRSPILLVRHPCAVVSSQMHRRNSHQTITEQVTHLAWQNGLPDVAENFIKLYPHTEEVLRRVQTWEEILAAIWCMDNYLISMLQRDSRLIILPYEKVLTNGSQTMKHLLNYMNLPWVDSIENTITSPSQTVVVGSAFDSNNPLSAWQSKLSRTQVQRILSVVQNFGIKFYSDAFEPDYDYLNSKSIVVFE